MFGFLDLSYMQFEEGWILFILFAIITMISYVKKWGDS